MSRPLLSVVLRPLGTDGAMVFARLVMWHRAQRRTPVNGKDGGMKGTLSTSTSQQYPPILDGGGGGGVGGGGGGGGGFVGGGGGGGGGGVTYIKNR